MEMIDVMIPGVIGAILVVAPNLFVKKTNDPAVDAPRKMRIRGIGVLLLFVAAIYFMIK